MVIYVCLEKQKLNYPEHHFKTIVLENQENIFLKKLKWWGWKLDLFCWHWNPKISKQINQLIKNFNPDIVHCHFGYEALTFLDNSSFKKPTFIHFHGYDASEMMRKKSYVERLRKLSLKSNIFLLGASNCIRERFGKLNFFLEQYSTLYYGIDLNLFQFEDNNVFEFDFIQVSNFVEKKGHVYSLKAFAKHKIKHPNSKMALIGDGPLMKKMKILAEKLNISDSVYFHGQLSKEKVFEYLKKAKVFVHHSITGKNGDEEGIPNAIMEAMALGLPVLSTQHAGIPELIEDQVNGYLVEERNVEELADSMRKVLQWDSFRLEKNRKKVESYFNMDIHNKQLEEHYLTAIEK